DRLPGLHGDGTALREARPHACGRVGFDGDDRRARALTALAGVRLGAAVVGQRGLQEGADPGRDADEIRTGVAGLAQLGVDLTEECRIPVDDPARNLFVAV